MRRTLAKFGLPFEKATPLVHFPKALKRPRNIAGPASRVINYRRKRVTDFERNRVIDYERNRVIDFERNRVIDYEKKQGY